VVAKITSRDFKRGRSNGLRFDAGRLREFGMGLALGLSLSVVILVYQNYRAKNAAAVAAEVPKPDSHAKAASAEPEEGAKNYDFYKMLPNFEVVVPEKESQVRSERNAPPANIDRPGVYVLQAGSYRKQEEADRIRAQLDRQGITASVQRVAVDDDVWHRVRIGPITDLTELNRLRARLRAADLDAIVIRVGE